MSVSRERNRQAEGHEEKQLDKGKQKNDTAGSNIPQWPRFD